MNIATLDHLNTRNTTTTTSPPLARTQTGLGAERPKEKGNEPMRSLRLSIWPWVVVDMTAAAELSTTMLLDACDAIELAAPAEC